MKREKVLIGDFMIHVFPHSTAVHFLTWPVQTYISTKHKEEND